MATIDDKKLRKIKVLYQNKNSAREIAENLGVSIDAVYYFLRRHDIPRRGRKENNFIQFSKKPPSFKIKKNLNSREKFLKMAGVMLYWGEGSQWPGATNVDFANSNPEMIKIFMRFLRNICGINEEKLRIYLYCYSNQNPDKLIRFWSRITKIPVKRFQKPYVRKDFQDSKTGKMKHGLVHVRYYDKKLFIQIKDWIREVVENYQ